MPDLFLLGGCARKRGESWKRGKARSASPPESSRRRSLALRRYSSSAARSHRKGRRSLLRQPEPEFLASSAREGAIGEPVTSESTAADSQARRSRPTPKGN